MAKSAWAGLLALVLCVLPVPVSAGVFFGHIEAEDPGGEFSIEAERALLAELEAALGNGHRHATDKRMKRIEQILKPMFDAVPKNDQGRLGAAASGYLLHRLFVQRNGWNVKGLQPGSQASESWSTTNPAAVLEGRVPANVQGLFEARLDQFGLGVKELAILAATLEYLVNSEAVDRLKLSYHAQNLTKVDVVSAEEAVVLTEVYMALYILGFESNGKSRPTKMTTARAREIHTQILDLYPNWPDTQEFLREVFSAVAPNSDYLFFNEVEGVIAEVAERYGRFQDVECRQIKDMMVAVEDPSVGGDGRVRISDFYKKAIVDGKWQFSESVEYLRKLGALDESDAENLRVIIPNYILGPSNCVASSNYYSVCCLNECDEILARLEQNISAPEASVSQIVDLISQIPSATVPGNRTLPVWLLHRLDAVAKHHDGRVPLHGRLFAQWLHYAYPRECAFPHTSGSRPSANGTAENNIELSEEEMKRIISEAAPPQPRHAAGFEVGAREESAMWSMQEELVVRPPPPQSPMPVWMKLLHTAMVVGLAFSLSAGAFQLIEPALSNLDKDALDKKYTL